MKKCCCFTVICFLFLCFVAAVRSWAEESLVNSTATPLRSAALKTTAPSYDRDKLPVTSSAITRANASYTGVAIAKETSRQRLELSPEWYLEGDYTYYYGASGPLPALSLDRPEVYAVYHLFPFDILTPYFRFGIEWLRRQETNLFSHGRPQNDAVNLHLGSGLRFGFAEHVALDVDAKYQVGGSRGRSDSWGGTVGVLFYF